MKLILFALLLFTNLNLKSQFCKRDYLEQNCHYPIENKEEIFKKVDTFLFMMSKKDSTYLKWIDENDIKNWVTPFDEISTYLKYPKYNKPTIVGIIDFEPNKYLIKVLLNYYPDTVTSSFIGVYSVLVSYLPNDKRYTFSDYRSYYINTYLEKFQQGNITYYTKNTSKLKKEKCEKFNDYNNKIASIFNTLPKKITYFHLKNSQELLNIYGWDVVYNMFYAPTGGFARHGGGNSEFKNYIMSGNDNEEYDHELIHLYYDNLFDSSKIINTKDDENVSTYIIGEGVPTYFGGSSGKTYKELKNTLSNYLAKNDSTKIQNHYKSNNIQIDKHTNYIYAMGAFITELYYKKDGLKGLKELANYSENNFIKNVSNYFEIKDEDLDNFLRTKIKQ